MEGLQEIVSALVNDPNYLRPPHFLHFCIDFHRSVRGSQGGHGPKKV